MKKLCIILLPCILIFSGCASYRVHVGTKPVAVMQVYLDGKLQGQTSRNGNADIQTKAMSIFHSPLVEVKRDGYCAYRGLTFAEANEEHPYMHEKDVCYYKRATQGFEVNYDIVFNSLPGSGEPDQKRSRPGFHFVNDSIMENQILDDDERAIAEIEAHGVGNRMVIPRDFWPKVIADSIAQNHERGRSIFVFRGGHGKVTGCLSLQISASSETKVTVAGGNRSVFVINGNLGPLHGNVNNPLRLVYLAEKGLIQIGGAGSLCGNK